MARLYFSIIETVENEYCVEIEESEIEGYLNGNKLIKQCDVDKMEFNQTLEYIETDYTTIEVSRIEND